MTDAADPMTQCLGTTAIGSRCLNSGLYGGYCWRHVPAAAPPEPAAPPTPGRPPISHADLVRLRAMKARINRGNDREERIGAIMARVLDIPFGGDDAIMLTIEPDYTPDVVVARLGLAVAPWFIVRDAYVANYAI